MPIMVITDLFIILQQSPFKVTLLSAPVSSELPFCKTTVLRKQLISPILFGRSKIGKKDVALHGLGNRKICNRNVSVKAGFVYNFSKVLLISEHWIYLSNYSKSFRFSFAMSLARLLIYSFTKSD